MERLVSERSVQVRDIYNKSTVCTIRPDAIDRQATPYVTSPPVALFNSIHFLP